MTPFTTAKNTLIGVFLGLSVSLAHIGWITPSLAETSGISAPTESVVLETSKGMLLRLDRPAKDVFIANPEVADVQVRSPRIIYVFGRVPGETTLYALDENENVIYASNVHVIQNIERIQNSIDQLLPEASINIESINGMLVMTGTVAQPEELETAYKMVAQVAGEGFQIINRVSVTTPTQINLRVKIAEVSRDVLKTLGFNWDAALFPGNDLIDFAIGNQTFQIIEDEATGLPVKEYFVRNGGANSVIGNLVGRNLDINTVVDALEGEGFLSVLAEPNLTALSGETASFLAGGEFPIPVPDQQNISLEFKQFGVGLQFTPLVLSENKINLKVAPEVSQLSNTGAITVNGISVPAITTRRAATTVELASGQSFAIAGLLQQNLTQDSSKFPGLGDIPILGALFRSERYQRRETELVIIVTPYIVRPIDNANIPLPTDGITAANDLDRILYSEEASKDARPKKTDTVKGAGFRLNDGQ